MLQANVFLRTGELSASLWAVLGAAIVAATRKYLFPIKGIDRA